MTGVHRSARALALLALLAPPAALHAQAGDSLQARDLFRPLPAIGGAQEDLARVRQVLGRESADGFLLRSPSSRDAKPAGPGLHWSVIPAQADVAWNSDIPFSLNDGALWAGRGVSAQVTAGVRLAAGPVALVLAPQLTWSENRDFEIVPQDSLGRSVFFPPWYAGELTVDLPIRFGDEPVAMLGPGQSSLTVTAGPAAFGAATENQWWGPGIHTAVVMSSNAEGFPHAFLRTSRPLRTRLGAFEGKWIVGGLSESLFFDDNPSNDYRSLSGLAATFRPARVPDLTVGVSRVVYLGIDQRSDLARRAFDVFRHWQRPRLVREAIPSAGSTEPDSFRVGLVNPGYDQILSVFGRWIFPRSGLEVYGEWARLELPASVTEMLNQPGHSQGYTLGAQWVRPLAGQAALRLHTELSYLEESSTFNNRPVLSYYVGNAAPQGYTHRGQVVGAATGPGSSSQWLRGDYLARGWRIGAFGGRVRWENDVYGTSFTRFVEVGHDVSVLGGIRGGIQLLGADVSAEVSREVRYNYLFQGPLDNPFGNGATDINNTIVRLSVTPAF
ncbi:MAG: capsule assembly Wzi family protein [Gemmatimonadota bacterium]